MPYVLKIEPEAREDIQEAVDWYNDQLSGLGKEFHSTVKAYLNDLRSNPFFQVRYEGVRCLPMNKFPYMIHFTVDEEKEIVSVHGVINTFLDPGIWKKSGFSDG